MDNSAQTLLCLDGRVIDLQRGSVTNDAKQPTTLRPQAAQVLRTMAASAGQIVTAEELLQALSQTVGISDDGLMQYIMEIRQALGDDRHQILRTGMKRGFVLEATAVASGPTAIEPPASSEPLIQQPEISEPPAIQLAIGETPGEPLAIGEMPGEQLARSEAPIGMPRVTYRGRSWMTLAAGLTVFVASGAYFLTVSRSEADRPVITAQALGVIKGNLAGAKHDLAGARADLAGAKRDLATSERASAAASGTARGLAANLLLAQREVEHLKAERARTREATEASLAADKRTLDQNREEIANLQRELAVTRQSVDDLKASATVAAATMSADAERRKAVEASLKRADNDLALERSKAQHLARDLEAARAQSDAMKNDLTRTASASREALEQEREKATGLERELAAARAEVDKLTAQIARRNSMKVAKAKAQRSQATAATARPARKERAQEVSEAEVRKPSRSIRLIASELPFSLLPTRRPLQEGLW